ncbi:MAG: hypothetical protein IT355_20670 [Gemmatimonadaceae bacterium]|nr:hypothetical protein [Gemmatimonadaceae bacterium]
MTTKKRGAPKQLATATSAGRSPSALRVVRSCDFTEAPVAIDWRELISLEVREAVVWPHPAQPGDYIMLHTALGKVSRWVRTRGAFTGDFREYTHSRESWEALLRLCHSGSLWPQTDTDRDSVLHWMRELGL